MARCEQGYLCQVCGKEVEDLRDSDLYLRYVLGEVDPETLHLAPERHLRCNPTLSQFIVAEGFPPVQVIGPFDKRRLDASYVSDEERRVSAAFLRLTDLFAANRGTPIIEYPDDTIRQGWESTPEPSQAAATQDGGGRGKAGRRNPGRE